MAWVVLVAAGLFETAFAVLLKVSDGMSRPWPTAGFAACALISFGLLTIALRELEVVHPCERIELCTRSPSTVSSWCVSEPWATSFTRCRR